MPNKMPPDFSFLNEMSAAWQPDARLSEHTTFHLGGSCPALITCQTPNELTRVVTQLHSRNIDYIVIGTGSNLLVSDEGLNCAVVRYVSETPIIECAENTLTVSGSTLLDAVVDFAAQHALTGLNFASGIYGTVGGAICGNAGAFGKKVGDVLTKAVIMDRSGEVSEVTPQALNLRYRNSALKETGEIIVSATFVLQPGNGEQLRKERSDILEKRKAMHPDPREVACAGSFFKNVKTTAADVNNLSIAWFLERAGTKALSVGGAAVYEKHANIIVAAPGCTAQNVYDLSQKIAMVLQERFHMYAVREVRLVGHFKGKPKNITKIFW